jgi:LmbE family N-acetylglucosaminyl deacetylase
LGDNGTVLRDRLVGILDLVNPEEVFVTSVIDAHPDHRVLARTTRDLVKARVGIKFYEYPVQFWDPRLWRVRQLRERRIRRVRADKFLARKSQAITAYRSQVTDLSGGRNGAVLSKLFLKRFLRREEVFFEIVAEN